MGKIFYLIPSNDASGEILLKRKTRMETATTGLNISQKQYDFVKNTKDCSDR
jgi:hypothetical protein